MLEELKDYLKITWEEEDLLLSDLLNAGKAYLDSLTGVTLEYNNLINKSLLFDYCRYAYNNSIEYFEENFRHQLLRLQLTSATMVKR